jgi:cytoskeletal protein RodZ
MLRDARERRGLSLRQIANTTKIGLAVLEGLEHNDISRLPGGIFSRGIVRSYATEVGLDPDLAMRDFLAQFPRDAVPTGRLSSLQAEDHLAVESERYAATTFVRLFAFSIPLAVAIIYLGSAGRPGVTPLAPQAEPVAAAGVEQTQPGPTPLVSARSADGDTAATTGSGSPDRLLVTLAARRQCWVSVTIDAQRAFEGLLQAGEQRTLETRGAMVLTIGDASALEMMLNGEKARSLGADGQVVTVRLNLTNFSEYVAAR